MQITAELPEDIALSLGPDQPELSRAALEALAAEGFGPGSSRPLKFAVYSGSVRGCKLTNF
ncbi:MAG TPA: hypothetical protein VF283_15985 [Bryobacteraceae bacterium]